MALADIVAAQKPTPVPRETRLVAAKAEIETMVTAAYTALTSGTPYDCHCGRLDGDVLIHETEPDLAAELREWVVAAGVRCALAWDGDLHPVLHVSVLCAPDVAVEGGA